MGDLRPASWPGDHPLFREVAPDVTLLEPGHAAIAVTVDRGFIHSTGARLHGGSYAVFAAVAAELATATLLDPGEAPALVEFRVQIFRPFLDGSTAFADARVVHRGRRFLAVTVELRDPEGRLCALATASLAPVPAPAGIPGVPPFEETISAANTPVEGGISFRYYGLEFVERDDGLFRVRGAGWPRFVGFDGNLHPVYPAVVADSATVPSFLGLRDQGITATTLEYKHNVLRPAAPGPVLAEARVILNDGRTHTVQVDAYDATGAHCGAMLTTLAVIPFAP